MAEIKYEVVEHIGVLSESAKGWKKELNRISWNGNAPKYDKCVYKNLIKLNFFCSK